MGLLTRVEEFISTPLEYFHNRKGFQPVDLNRLAQRCMESGSRKGIRRVYAPNRYEVLLSEWDFAELHPFLETICADIGSELQRVAEERDYMLAGEISVEIKKDPSVSKGFPQVKGHMQGDEEPRSVVTFSEENQGLASDTNNRDCKTVLLMREVRKPEKRAKSTVFRSIRKPAGRKRGPWAAAGGNTGTQPEIRSREIAEESPAEKSVAPRPKGACSNPLAWGQRPATEKRPLSLPFRPEKPPALPAPAVPVKDSQSSWGEINGMGVFLHFTQAGIVVENRQWAPEVKVNGAVATKRRLADGDRLQIGTLELTFHQDSRLA